MFYRLWTLDALLDPSQLLHLTRRHSPQQACVVRIKIVLKNVGVIKERPFLHRHFSMKIDGIFKNCSCFIDYRLLMLY